MCDHKVTYGINYSAFTWLHNSTGRSRSQEGRGGGGGVARASDPVRGPAAAPGVDAGVTLGAPRPAAPVPARRHGDGRRQQRRLPQATEVAALVPTRSDDAFRGRARFGQVACRGCFTASIHNIRESHLHAGGHRGSECKTKVSLLGASKHKNSLVFFGAVVRINTTLRWPLPSQKIGQESECKLNAN